tara:strand:- start:1508 stop:1627 length:120 start_codon:yes stop_codon:yes gene_type:complete
VLYLNALADNAMSNLIAPNTPPGGFISQAQQPESVLFEE